ncbi:MAG: hypothetical protein KGO96_13435 [Elusimicrobia bacterium]|nr:hypothetical protein [Elusimicrobiota bacterium]MDE2237983.1 hypothetical protein [Elusimicrobiota bacterium]MDE2426897.1 hypothetical protein [Elusimicrobiota bacterium]
MDNENALPATKSDLRALERRFDGLERKFDVLERKSDVLERKLDASVGRLDKKIDSVALAVIGTQDRVRKIEERMATKDDVGRILGAIEHFAGKSDSANRAALIYGKSLTEAQATLNDHERRIVRLEAR